MTSPETPSVHPPFILSLDIGTSSTRAVLFDRFARPLPNLLAQVPNHLRTTPDGGAEFELAEFLTSVVAVIDEVIDLAGPLANQIGGVAMATLVSNIAGLDAAGQPVTPVYTYADTRNAPEAEALRQEFGNSSAVHDRTGCLIHSSYLPARFLWLARTQPELLARVHAWVSIGEYLLQEFFGQRLVSFSVASWTGLLNRHELTWDRTWLARLPVQESQLSPLANVDQSLSGLRPSWAERWPALKNVPWFPAMADGAVANLGSGCDTPYRVALTIGTTGAMRVVLDQTIPAIPGGLWAYRVDKRRALLGAATSEGGNVFAWLRQTLQLPGHVEAELACLSPTAHGLTVLPFVAGERAPGWRGELRASLIGFTLNTRPIDILRASLEAIAYRFALIHQRLASHLPPDHQIIASGSGLLSSPAWLQIMADVLGRPLIASAEQEATSRGAALLALEALDLLEDRPAALGKIYHPNPTHHAPYQAALAKQVDCYNALLHLF